MPVPTAMLGVVIVTHNNEHDLKRCLDSLQTIGNASDAYVIVRDCNSTDQTVELAKEHPIVSKVVVGENVGYGSGCNSAVQAIERPIEMVLILNPDTVLDFDVADLLSYVDRYPGFGCASVRQESFDGHLVWSWDEFPSSQLEWRKAKHTKLLQRSTDGYGCDRRVDWTMGAFLLIPYSEYKKVKGFDEQFFMFCEETDLCKRLNTKGAPTYYIDSFRFLHDRSDKGSLWREVLRINSRRMYDKKWLSRSETLACQFAHTYRWLHDAVHPARPRDRYLAFPRLLATWDLIHAVTPPDSVQTNLDSWRSVRPFWSAVNRS